MEKNDGLGSVYINGKKYRQVLFSNEDDFEAHLKSHANSFYDDCFLFDFKYTFVTNDIYDNNVIADLLIIDKNYKFWAILELEYYSRRKYEWLSRHVIPQMKKITGVNYRVEGKKVFNWLVAKYPSATFDKAKTKALMSHNRPFFFVALNTLPDHPKQWAVSLHDCDIFILKTFIDYFDKPVFVKEKISGLPKHCLLARSGRGSNRWVIDRPSLFTTPGSKDILAQENIYKTVNNKRVLKQKNIIKFKIGDNKNLVIEGEKSLSSSHYTLYKDGGVLKIIKTKKD